MSDYVHDDEPIGTSGIEEGHARVPPWLILVIVGLLIFFVSSVVFGLAILKPLNIQI